MATVQEPVAARTVSPWRQRLAAFWRWWTGELVHLLPERFAQLGGRTRLPIIEIAGDELILVEPKSAVGPQTRIAIAALDEPQRRQALRTLLERAGEQRQRVRVCLCHGEALVRRVTMPAATEENLSQVLAFEMDRLTPFRADDVYFDYRVVSRDAAAGQIGVQLAVARRELVDAQVAKMRALGASVQGVTVRDGGNAGFDLDLLPSEQRGERESSRERLVHRLLAAAVVVLAVLALLLPVWEKRQAVLGLHPVVAKAKQEAEAVVRHGNLGGMVIEGVVAGTQTGDPALLQALQNRPRGAFTKDGASWHYVSGELPGTERFVISAEARPRAAVEARPLLESVPAPAEAPKNPAAAPAK